MWATITLAANMPHGDHAPDSHEAELNAPEGQIHPTITDVLVDPPRAGLSPRALDALLERQAQLMRIARDLSNRTPRAPCRGRV